MFESFVEMVRALYPQEKFIPLHRPLFIGNEKKYLLDTIDSSFVSSVGEYVGKFENAIADFSGSPYGVAVTNGTAALHTALMVAGVKRGDLVLTQSLTFVATCNSICYQGADPCFVDISRQTLNIDPVKLKNFLESDFEIKDGGCVHRKSGRKVSALVVMHTFGHMAPVDILKEICEEHKIIMIEDAAEALGSQYNGKCAGTFADVGIFSFNGNKTITSGGGGVLITNREDWALKAKHLTTTAKRPHTWDFYHDCVGYNYRLPNLNAALGLAQMEMLPEFLKKKRGIAEEYIKFFKNYSSEVTFMKETPGCLSNYWLNIVLLRNREHRNQFLEFTNSQDVMTRPAWVLMNDLPMFARCLKSDLSDSYYISDRLVNIPSSVPLVG